MLTMDRMSRGSKLIVIATAVATTTLFACGGGGTDRRPAGSIAEGHDSDAPCLGGDSTAEAPVASDGGDGGDGGRVVIRFAALELAAIHELVAAHHVDAGRGGRGGAAAVDANGVALPTGSRVTGGERGADGRPGEREVHLVPDLPAVDPSGVREDDALLVTAGGLYLKTVKLQGPLRVRRLVVAPGTSLELAGGFTIEASEIVVSPGASIIISDRGDRTDDVIGNAFGHHGGDLVLRADRLELHGDLIASGRPGDRGQGGGRGGTILVETRNLVLGSDAGIHASGGDGGDGLPAELPSCER